MPSHAITTPHAPGAIGPYSQAIRTGHLLFVSGQIPLRPDGTLVTGDIEEQTHQVCKNIHAILDAAGLSPAAIVKTTIFLTDLGHFAKVNAIYGSYVASPPPARSTIQVSALPRGAAIEIETIAAFPTP